MKNTIIDCCYLFGIAIMMVLCMFMVVWANTPDTEASSEPTVSEEQINTSSDVSEPDSEIDISEPEPEPEESVYIKLTEEERRIFATLIRLEAGGESYECQLAVGSVVLNRMRVTGKSLTEVVFQKSQFSPARLINVKNENGEYKYKPYQKNWNAVDELCKNGPTLPYYVMFFRANRHHSWGIPYCQIDNTYFSYVQRDV